MGPLSGIKVIELQGIGPGPFCCMMLSDLGADVIRVDRAGSVRGGDPAQPPADVLARGRRSIGVDLKNPEGAETVLRLVEGAAHDQTYRNDVVAVDLLALNTCGKGLMCKRFGRSLSLSWHRDRPLIVGNNEDNG